MYAEKKADSSLYLPLASIIYLILPNFLLFLLYYFLDYRVPVREALQWAVLQMIKKLPAEISFQLN